MPDSCKIINEQCSQNYHYKKVLLVVLFINISMFLVEAIAGFYSGSQSLLADALDFFGDAVNYGISIYVLNKSITTRARASIFKGISLGIFGLWVVGGIVYKAFTANDSTSGSNGNNRPDCLGCKCCQRHAFI